MAKESQHAWPLTVLGQLTNVVCVAVVTLLPARRLSSSVMALRNALPRCTLLLLAEFPGETL
jgi:hypothetical protein